jgi:hypothetical protein
LAQIYSVTCFCLTLSALGTWHLITAGQNDPATGEFLAFCDLVKNYGKDNNLPRALRVRLTEYFSSSRDVVSGGSVVVSLHL